MSKSWFWEKQVSSLQRHTENLQQMANHEDKVFVHYLLVSLTRPREARSCVLVTLAREPSWGAKLLQSAQPRRTRFGSACRPQASCACRPLANGGAGVGRPNDGAGPSRAVPCGVSVSVVEKLCRHLKTVEFGAEVWAKACPLWRMHGSLACSELPPRTHLQHRRWELPRSMCCRIQTTSPTSGWGELVPEMWWEVKSRATSPSPAIRPCFVIRLPYSARVTSGAVAGKHAKQFVGYFQAALAQENTCQLCTLGLSPFRATTPALFFLPTLPPRITKVWNANQISLLHSTDSEVSLCALWYRSSSRLAVSLSLSAIAVQASFRVCGGAPFRDAGAVTVPRLRRYHQMVAAIGWLQRNLGRSEEGRVS